MAILFLTGNRDKFREAQAIISELEMLDVDLPEVQSDHPEVIIKAKLEEARRIHDAELIVEDTSLHVDGLGGLPGPLVKWFLKAIGPSGIAQMALASGNAGATARCVIGYAKPAQPVQFFDGTVSGVIVPPRGSTAFGWDPIFLPNGSSETFGEMDPKAKNGMSHRRRALDALNAALRQ